MLHPYSPEERAILARRQLPRLKKAMASCVLCPQECNVLRFRDERGECGLGSSIFISSSHLHFGEEPAISGSRGSGTLFFSGCNLSCVYCQNYPISQLGTGIEESPRELAERFLNLQNSGAHNINLVTPTPQIHGIIEAVSIAWDHGLSIPIVYNCGGYESSEIIKLLDGLIDIYLVDCKYGMDQSGMISGVDDYFQMASNAIREMYRQTGQLQVVDNGIAEKGVIIRHLVIPDHVESSLRVLDFLKNEFGTKIHISLMSQYFPSHIAKNVEGINRTLSRDEYTQVCDYLEQLGLTRGWIQPPP